MKNLQGERDLIVNTVGDKNAPDAARGSVTGESLKRTFIVPVRPLEQASWPAEPVS